MSQQDRREFLAAEGVDDWVVFTRRSDRPVFSVPPGRIGAACRIESRAYPGIELGTSSTIAATGRQWPAAEQPGWAQAPNPSRSSTEVVRTRNLYQKGRAGAPAAS